MFERRPEMLTIEIPGIELYNQEENLFVETKGFTLKLEHSLVSLSKWESIYCKPFLTREEKTRQETLDYIQCMTITQNVDPESYLYIPNSVIAQVSAYIEHPMTATTFGRDNRRPSREIITAEIIYYWMITYNIPFECQKWHLNRLLTLINVCNIKNQPTKKLSKSQIHARNRSLNAARRAALNTKG